MSFQREEDRNTQENTVLSQDSGIGSLAGILAGIQTSLADLSAASKTQAAAFQALHEDLLVQEDTGDLETEGNDGASHTVDPNCVVTALLDSSEDGAIQPPSQESSDTEPKTDLLDSLTQAFISYEKKSPAIASKIADLIDSVLSGNLSAETAKEREKKYHPPENCNRVCTVTVNEEIWDLLPRQDRTVDLAFQRVQDTLIQGLSSLALLADKLAKDVQSKSPVNTTEILHHVMDSLVLFTQANWSVNMKRREFIKPALEAPFTRLCKPDIATTTKLFGDDLPKQFKDMTEVSRAGNRNNCRRKPQSKNAITRNYMTVHASTQTKGSIIITTRNLF